MAIRINYAGASILKPGTYSSVQVLDSGVAAPALGIIALIGESTEGAPFSEETGLSAVTFGPDEFAAIQEKFGAGPLVDAARLAISPSNDAAILGGAQELILIKTNAAAKASTQIKQSAAVYGTVSAKRSGSYGNQLAARISTVGMQVVITLSRLDTGETEISEPLGGHSLFTIQATNGTAATLTITDKKLTTTITGGTTAQNLDMKLDHFPTIKALTDYIAAQPGYSVTLASAAAGTASSKQMDQVTAQDIKTAAVPVTKDAYEVREFFAQSHLADFAPAIYKGLPTAQARTFLTGGDAGGTSQAAIQDALDALLRRRVNFIVPLFSRDAADDSADGITESSSNYDIDAIHAAVNSHVKQASTTKGKKERQAWVAYQGTFDDTVEKAAVLSSERVALTFQNVDVLSASTGLIESMQPHMLAVISAGMKAAAPVGLPNTFKQPLISGFSHAEFEPETQADKALAANLTFVEKTPAGAFRFVLDNSTYSLDDKAWIYNRPAVMYAADTAAYSIRLNTEQFIGQRNSDVSEETVKNVLVGVFDQLKAAGVIVGDSKTGGRGYKDLTVRIKGSIVEIGVTLALVEGLEFVLSTIRVQRAG